MCACLCCGGQGGSRAELIAVLIHVCADSTGSAVLRVGGSVFCLHVLCVQQQAEVCVCVRVAFIVL